jgi:hypothetical protein
MYGLYTLDYGMYLVRTCLVTVRFSNRQYRMVFVVPAGTYTPLFVPTSNTSYKYVDRQKTMTGTSVLLYVNMACIAPRITAKTLTVTP